MPNYHEIKEAELKFTQKFSNKKLAIYIGFHRALSNLCSDFFFWSLSFIVFMLFPLLFLDNSPIAYLFYLFVHLLYWKYWGQNWVKKEMSPLREEIELTIEVLLDIQKERNEK